MKTLSCCRIKKAVRLLWFNIIYKHHDTTTINGVDVHTYWKLEKCIYGPGYLCIPLRLKREDASAQVLEVLHEFRKALALRILRQNKLK